jgi:hypothetical protein
MVLLDGLPHHRDTLLEPLDVNWDHVSIELAEVPEIDHVLGIGRIENKKTEVRTPTVVGFESMPSEGERRGSHFSWYNCAWVVTITDTYEQLRLL